MSAVTKKQKARLAIMAREAWSQAGKPGRFDDWRHELAVSACGKRISEADSRDVTRLMGAFARAAKPGVLGVKGEEREFAKARLPLARKVQALLCDNGLNWAYADGIAKQMYTIARIEWCRSAELRAVITALIKQYPEDPF